MAQTNRAIDSLYFELKKPQSDTNIIKLKIELAVQWRLLNLDSTLKYAKEIRSLSKRVDYVVGLSKSVYLEGLVYYLQGDLPKALPFYEESIKLLEPLGDSKDLAKIYINTGVLYSSTNNNPKALDVYYKSLKILEKLGEEKLTALALGNIGTIHYYNHEYEQAILFSSRALTIDRKLGNTAGVAMHLGNIGSYYMDIGTALKEKGKSKEAKEQFQKAIKNQLEAFALNEKLDNKNGMAMNMGNLAGGFSDLGDTALAFKYYEKAYKLDSALGNKLGMSRHLGNMGWMYLNMGKYKMAEHYMTAALNIVKEENDHALLCRWHSNLSGLYEVTKQYDLALEHFKMSEKYKDSLFSIENAKKNLETEMNFEFQKKEAAAKEENERQTLYRNIFIAGFAAMFIMAILIFRSYRIKQKANKLVSEQKELLEIKNKEITDSIKYAKRIQNAHMPSNEYISKKLNELKKQ